MNKNGKQRHAKIASPSNSRAICGFFRCARVDFRMCYLVCKGKVVLAHVWQDYYIVKLRAREARAKFWGTFLPEIDQRQQGKLEYECAVIPQGYDRPNETSTSCMKVQF